jgi:hypothetical protein
MIEVERLGARLVRLRGADGRVLYVEVRSVGDRVVWYVHVDGHGRAAARSYPSPTRELAMYRLASELGAKRTGGVRC